MSPLSSYKLAAQIQCPGEMALGQMLTIDSQSPGYISTCGFYRIDILDLHSSSLMQVAIQQVIFLSAVFSLHWAFMQEVAALC